MASFNIWDLCHVHMRKIIFIISLIVTIFIVQKSHAQVNYHEFSSKQIYFGINLGINSADFKIKPAPKIAANDTIFDMHATRGPGFNLGIIGNLQFHRNFDLRFVPTLSFSDKQIEFNTIDNPAVKKTIESIYLSFPVSLRFKSDPINDFTIYVIGGFRYDFDLASNQMARLAENQIKIKRNDIALEYGIGFQFYFPFFILAPEFKVSHGLINIHAVDEQLIFSRAIDKLFSRTFTISLNLEG